MSVLPHRPTIFIDRNSGGRTFRDLITSESFRVVLHDEHFKGRTPKDEEWLKEIGDLGWIMVTGDLATAKSPLFLAELKRSESRVFLLNGLNGATRENKAKCIIDNYETMVRISGKYPAPLLWSITKDGRPYNINFRERLGMMRRSDAPRRE